MFKYLIFLFVLLIGCGGQAPVSEPPATRSVNAPSVDIDKMRNQTIIMVRKVDDVYDMYCSGVWVSPTQVLTAHHCVQGGILYKLDPEQAISIIEGETEMPDMENHVLYYRTHADFVRDHQATISQRARQIKVVAVEKPTDMALLEIEGPVPQHDIATIHDGPIVDGSFVWALGHSAGMHFTVSYGVISASRRDNDLTLLQVSVPISPGNSGGGVYDLDGKLVGVVSAMHRTAAQISFATHRDSIKDFLDANGGLKK